MSPEMVALRTATTLTFVVIFAVVAVGVADVYAFTLADDLRTAWRGVSLDFVVACAVLVLAWVSSVLLGVGTRTLDDAVRLASVGVADALRYLFVPYFAGFGTAATLKGRFES